MPTSSPRVDVHSHVLPLDCLRELQRLDPERTPRLRPDPDREGWELIDLAGRVVGPVVPGLYDINARLRDQQARGIDVDILSVMPFTFYYWTDAQFATRAARLQNEAIAGVVRDHPDHFVGLATVPLQDVRAAIAELERGMRDLGLVGVELCTNVDGRNLDDPDLEPFWDAAEQLGAFIFFHPDRVAGADRLGRHYLINTLGNPIDTTIAIGSLVLGGVLERHPGLNRLCFAHGGGFAPYQAARLDHAWRQRADARGAIARPPSELIRGLHFDTILFDPGTLGFLARRFGPTQVLLGTDYPFDMQPDDPVGQVNAVPNLSDDERAAILGGNAARLLGLGRSQESPARTEQERG